MRLRSLAFFVSVAAAFACSAPATAQVPVYTGWAAKPVPTEVFGEFPVLDQPRISPDGVWIAAKIRSGGNQILAVLPVDAKAGKPVPIARDGDFARDKMGEKEIVNWQWVDSDHLLIWIRTRDNLGGQWYDNVRVASYIRTTGKIVPLAWDDNVLNSTVLWTSPTEPRILLQRAGFGESNERSDNPEVLDVNLDTGRYTVVQRSNPLVSGWEVDADGVVRMGSSFDRDSGKVRVLYRPDAGSTLRTVVEQKVDRYGDMPLPSVFLKGNKAYAYSNEDGYRALYEYDLANMKLGKKLYGVTGYDIDGVNLSPDDSRIDAVTVTQGRTGRHYFDARLKEIQSVLEESFGKGNVLINSADDKREKIIFTAAELGQVPTVYVFDTHTGKVDLLAFQNQELRNARLNPVSVVRYKASDGLEIEAVLTMPRHRAGEKNLPLIVMPHGGPEARDKADWDFYQWAQAFAERGYVVIQPNYRGSTGYGREFHKAVERSWGYRMQDDLNDAVAWLAAQGIADAKRACVVGWSYGGYAASRAAQRDGAKYRCAISGAGVHDLPAMMAYDRSYLGTYGAKTFMGTAGNDLKDISPSLHAADYSTPILIVHGARDQRVPVAQSRTLISRLKSAGKKDGVDFVYLEQPLNTHNLLREEDRTQFLRESLKFLEAHNPAYLPTDKGKPTN